MLNDKMMLVKKISAQEHFQNNENNENKDENEKILQDIKAYLSRRVFNFDATLKELENTGSCVYVPKDEFTEPIVINKNNVETNETKIMSDSPVYVPANLYVDGPVVIGNDNTFSSSVNGSFKTDKISINVGKSGRNPKKIKLPFDGITVDPKPINQQDPRWTDKFSVSVSGRDLTVERIDVNSGWGQPLVLRGSYINDKNLCMGDNCYSEKDILYIIQDLLPYYNMVPKGGDEIKELCFESYDTLNNHYKLPELEAINVREGLDYNGRLIALRDIVKEYIFYMSDSNAKIPINVGKSNVNPKKVKLPFYGITVDPTPINQQNPRWRDKFSVSVSGRDLTVKRIDANTGWGQFLVLNGRKKNVDRNLIIANSLRTDYNLIEFISKYPGMLSLVAPNLKTSINVGDNVKKFIDDFKKEIEERYSEIKKNVDEKNIEINSNNCIGGEELRILKGERDIKLETEDPRIIRSSNLNGWERWQANKVDWMRRYFKNTGQLKRTYLGKPNVQMYDENDIYYDNSITARNLTDLPYLNEQHFEIHGYNDDNNDCMAFKKLKVATMSKSIPGDERQRNGAFNIELEPGKEGETGVFCRPI